MAGKYGVQETKDVIALAQVVAIAIIVEIKKDGFQIADLGAFLKSPDFEAALGPALENISLVPAEVTELDVFDGLSLARAGYELATSVIAELKK